MRVLVHKVIQLLSTDTKAGDTFAGMKGFAPVVDHPFFNQLQYTVGQQLGMQAQILVIAQIAGYRFADFTYAKLNSGAIFDQQRHILADTLSARIQLGRLDFR